ncbi:Olfactory receptor 2AG1 [Dissostichus eleginoides]|uniref:Olfactory receptor 2AG1 n=1 Tax=Dissostichus eleginoides TaxID=100907 RepID=A0AAD9B984_DISEL|nr:Olfactory receptor 2AG1 [Dissostichus eleginoides]
MTEGSSQRLPSFPRAEQGRAAEQTELHPREGFPEVLKDREREHGRRGPRGEEEQAELPVRYLHANGETRFARRWSEVRPGRKVRRARRAAGKARASPLVFSPLTPPLPMGRQRSHLTAEPYCLFLLCCHPLSPLTLQSAPGRALWMRVGFGGSREWIIASMLARHPSRPHHPDTQNSYGSLKGRMDVSSRQGHQTDNES